MDISWQIRGKCRKKDPELFFPVGNTGPALQQIAEAKAVCRRCPVANDCLAWALDTGQDAGVWGGMSEDERRALKRRHNERTSVDAESANGVNAAAGGPDLDGNKRYDGDKEAAA